MRTLIPLTCVLWVVLNLSGALTGLLIAQSADGSTTPTLPDAPVFTAPSKYVRLTQPNDTTTALQVAVRELVPSAPISTRIWLVGVVHLGTSNYFHAIQQLLDTHDVVLYEGIGHVAGTAMHDPEADSGLQSLLAQATGLVFQLAALDYNRTHFHNSDLNVARLQEILSRSDAAIREQNRSIEQDVASTENVPERGTGTESDDALADDSSPATRSDNGPETPEVQGDARDEFDQLIGVLDGSNWIGRVLHFGARWMGGNPKLQTMTRWVLLELLGELEGQIPDSPSLPSGLREMLRVLVEERNAQVHRDTLKWLETSPPPRSIAILYGVGHMPDLEKRLRQSPGVETGQELWFTAFDVDPMAAGLNATERAFTRALIQRQLDGLRAELNASNPD